MHRPSRTPRYRTPGASARARAAGAGPSSWVPGWELARNYHAGWWRSDLLAGLVLASILLPQGMAYAQLAGLPPVTGLYTTVAALTAYAVFGPSRIIVLGPDSALASMIAVAVLPLAAGDPDKAVELASVLALLTGTLCVVAGLVRLGAITELLSKPIRIGYINGLAIIIVVGQLPILFGFDVDADGFFGDVSGFLRGIPETSGRTLAVGGGVLIVMIGLRWASPRFPAALVGTVTATAVVAGLGLAGDGVSVIGELPSGVPSPSVPTVDRSELLDLVGAALGVSLVAFADTSALSSTVGRAAGNGANDPSREAVGLGAANLAAGLVQGFPVSASTTRTVVATSVGSKSQVTGLVGASAVLVVLLAGRNLVADLPLTALAAVIMLAAWSLLDLRSVWWMLRVRASDFWLCVITTAGVVVVGVFEGIAIAVGLSLTAFVAKAWRPHDAVLGQVADTRGYHDIERHPEALLIPGLLIFRFDAPIFFANADHFRRRLDALLEPERADIEWVVLAAEPITDVDTSGAEMLGDLLDDLDTAGIRLVVAALKGPVKDRMRRYGLYDRIGDDAFYPTLGSAVRAYETESGAGWVEKHEWPGGAP